MSSTLLLKPLPSPEAEDIAGSDGWFLTEGSFLRMLALERKRTERSHRRFVLMLLQPDSLLKDGNSGETFNKVLLALFHSTRETDLKGWYKTDSVIGVIFTELGGAEGKAVANALLAKIFNALGQSLSIEQINEIRVSFHLFPEDAGGAADFALYPELVNGLRPRRGAHLLKRSMDIVGSLAALIVLSPLLAAIAVLIRLTSKGPVLFRQERIGQYGRRFTFLKFRSMSVSGDQTIHEDFMKALISGTNCAQKSNGSQGAVYKIVADPRVTALGNFLRRTSLDELPQFFNVLSGAMSMVGPRPPIPYEFQLYDIWHRRRVLAVKPGITGLWQVQGRSRVTFNEMVRMDLQYARSWSPWLDVKILLRTPRAVLSGSGAY